jgi:hypothetical protein
MIVMQGTKTINKQIKIEAHMSLSYSHEIIKSYAECNQFRLDNNPINANLYSLPKIKGQQILNIIQN